MTSTDEAIQWVKDNPDRVKHRSEGPCKESEYQERAEAVQRLLENLTPGGSEFVDDPQRCYAFVKDRLLESHRKAVNAIKERKALEELLREAVGLLDAGASAIDHPKEPMAAIMVFRRAALDYLARPDVKRWTA